MTEEMKEGLKGKNPMGKEKPATDDEDFVDNVVKSKPGKKGAAKKDKKKPEKVIWTDEEDFTNAAKSAFYPDMTRK